MAGHFQVISKIEKKAIEHWLSETLSRMKDIPIGIHFDDLFKASEIIDKGPSYWIALYLYLIHLPYDKIRYKTIMTLPLACKDSLDWNNPTFEEIERIGRDGSEPPSFYLITRHSDEMMELCEEYIKPLAFKELGKLGENIKVYYRSYRQADALTYGWEFSRCIYFEHYHETLLSYCRI
jgi:hypothetical protein